MVVAAVRFHDPGQDEVAGDGVDPAPQDEQHRPGPAHRPEQPGPQKRLSRRPQQEQRQQGGEDLHCADRQQHRGIVLPLLDEVLSQCVHQP